MSYVNPEWLTIDESTLRELHLGAGECAEESETHEAGKAFSQQAKVINAIGAYRFPETWGDGLPGMVDTKNASEKRGEPSLHLLDSESDYGP